MLLVVLMAAMAAGPVFNFGLGSMSAQIVDSYGITDGQFGYIITTVFLSASVTATFLGVLADRIPTRVQLALILAGIMAAFLVSASHQAYWVLIVAALIAGPAQAFSNPVTNRIIARKVPETQRATWMGWKQSGVQLGLLVAGLTFPLVGVTAGWRGAALLGAALCLPMIVIAWIVLSRLDHGSTAGTTRVAAGLPDSAPVGSHATAPEPRVPAVVWLFTVTSFLNAVGTQGVNAYASLFAVRALDYSVQRAGLVLGVIGVIGLFSRIGWGKVAGRLGQPAPLIQLMSLGGILGLLFLIAAERLQASSLMWAGVALHAALPLAANVVINSGIVSVVPSRLVGLASGLVATGMYLGFAIGPAVVGRLVDATGGFTAGFCLIATAYLACGCVAWLLGRRMRRSRSSTA